MRMEQVLSRENLLEALHRVERNKGSHGVDGMSVSELYMMEQWHEIRTSLLEGTYKPQPVRRVEIPKPNGGKRKLGIPTVIDRFIQQALNQALTPLFDPGFSENSFGFRRNKNLDKWIRRSLRMMIWKQWKKQKTKIKKLIQLGVQPYKAYEWGNSRKSYWRISKSSILHQTLGNSYWSSQGLKSLYSKYGEKRHLFD